MKTITNKILSMKHMDGAGAERGFSTESSEQLICLLLYFKSKIIT